MSWFESFKKKKSDKIKNLRKRIHNLEDTKLQSYNSVKDQNHLISMESSKMRDKYSTDIQRSKHINNHIMGWNVVNFYLWWIYYIIVAVVIYLIIKDRLNIPENRKIHLGLLLLIYPFFISTIELFFYNVYHFLVSLINGVPYPKYSNKPMGGDSVFNSLPAFYY
jgi:hypothetical protein